MLLIVIMSHGRHDEYHHGRIIDRVSQSVLLVEHPRPNAIDVAKLMWMPCTSVWVFPKLWDKALELLVGLHIGLHHFEKFFCRFL